MMEILLTIPLSSREYDDFRLHCVEHGYRVQDRVREMILEETAR